MSTPVGVLALLAGVVPVVLAANAFLDGLLWYKVVCPDTVKHDWAIAKLKDTTTKTTATILAKTCSNSGAWTQASGSVTAGHKYTLTLTSHDDNKAGDPTYTLYDDVAIACP